MTIPERNKLFSVQEASGMLPELSTIMDEFRDRKQSYFKLNREVTKLKRQVEVEYKMPEELDKKERILKAIVSELESLINQVNDLGCYLKDPDSGLVDFTSIYKGRKVFLCWKQGEKDIKWFHDINSGFAGRERITNPKEFKNRSGV